MGKITVCFDPFLAHLTEQNTIEFPVKGEISVTELEQLLKDAFPALLSVNLNYVYYLVAGQVLTGKDAAVHEGEQVTLVQPLYGG